MIFKANDRWRGIMPFRCSKKQTESITLTRRTSEPSPVPSPAYHWLYPEGYGKAAGSFTEKMRLALHQWLEVNGEGSRYLTFEYRLSRHRTILVKGLYHYLRHRPGIGHELMVGVVSIDGSAANLFLNPTLFLWERIVAREKLLALPLPKGNAPAVTQ